VKQLLRQAQGPSVHKGALYWGSTRFHPCPDYWTVRKIARRAHGPYGTLDGASRPWAGVGRDQLDWVQKTLADWDKARTVSSSATIALTSYLSPWEFWVTRLARSQRLKPYERHQILVTSIRCSTTEIGTMRSIGMLATAWPWPYAPEACPAHQAMIRPTRDFTTGGRSDISMKNDRSERVTSCGP